MKKEHHSRSGFFNPRILVSLSFCLIGIFPGRSVQAQAQAPQVQQQAIYRGISPVVHFDISPPLREMTPAAEPGPESKRENEEQGPVPLARGVDQDPVVQSKLLGGVIDIQPPIVSFDGPPNLCGGCAPPDPNGDISPTHVVVMDNLHFQIFNKTGTSLFGPVANNTLWAGFGGPCQTQNAGDPVVLHDQQADRWILSQFTSGSAPFFNCVAISQTSDPTGAYFRYAVLAGPGGANFPDYPKYGIWPDAYYISTREFAGGSSFAGVGAYALNRAQLLAGNPTPTIISFVVPPGATPYNIGDGLLPSDWDGVTPPPAGSPNYFVGSMDNNGPYGAPQDALTLWKFQADFVTPGNSTFTLTNTLNTAPFNSILALCGGGRSCIPQPGTTNRIDHLGYRQRPLFRLAYRNFGTHESLVTNQSVSAGAGPGGEVSGVRWYELRSPNSSPVIFQQGTYAPGLTDGVHRWMGSIAMDSQGNMGLGFSASNGVVFPSVWYTGRLAGDTLGQMTLGENAIVQGTGSQTGGGSRWGDYTSTTVDPADDLTFWHVNEYVPTTSSATWRLRVGSFKALPGGASPTPPPPPTPSPTPTPGNPPTNDLCPAAIVIPPAGPFPHLTSPIDVTSATSTGDPPLPSCQTSVSRSIWYTFTPAVTGSYTISSCQTEAPAATLPDIVLAIYTSAGGCAGPFTQLPGVAGCDDDSCTTLALQAIISNTTLTAGTQYYIMAHKFGTTAPVAPANAIQFRVSLFGAPTPTPSPTPPATPTPSPTPASPTPTVTPSATPTPSAPPATPTPSAPPATPTPSAPPATPTPSAPPATPTPSASPASQAVNLSTRMNIQTGNNVGIGGFIIQGTAPKHVLLRAIGPSLTITGALADPVLELHGPAGFTTVINNNWQDDPAQAVLITATGLAPTNTLEAAIDATLNPGAYTAIVRGNGNTSGIGLIEVYDLSQAVLSKLANISTRALVGTGNDIVIAGFILGNNSGGTRLVVRGIGGSLTLFGVPNALANPNLEVRNSSGALLASNNDWADDPAQAAELTAAGLAPTNAQESGIAITLGPGQYTALLAGQGGSTGVGVVEVYDRGAP